MFAESLITVLATAALQGHPVVPSARAELPVSKYVQPSIPAPVKRDIGSFGVAVSARSAVVMDVASGVTLYEKDAATAYPIASITKLMTAMVLLDERLDPEEVVTVTAEDTPSEGKMVFQIGERLTRRELLEALLVGSVNEAGNALGRTFPGGMEAFVRQMNRKSGELGLKEAVFTDPTGLDADNRGTARDVARMMRAALNYSEIREITDLQQIELRGRLNRRRYLIKSTNQLLGSFLNKAPYRIVVAKTGSLPEAGYCLAQTTKDGEGNEVIAVILGSDNHFARYDDVKALTFWAFKTYEWPKKAAWVPREDGRM